MVVDLSDVTPDVIVGDPAALAGIEHVEVLVNGQPLAAPADCTHTSLTFQPLVGIVRDDEGTVTGWQLRVRARCALCGVPFAVDMDSARPPADHPLGVVFDLYPLAEDPGDLPRDATA